MKLVKKIILTMILFLSSCDDPSEVKAEIEGNFKFKYPSGQVEALSIKDNHTFKQTIYSNEKDFFTNDNPLYRNEGRWNNRDHEIEFEHWLSICYLGRGIDSILPQPEHYTIFGGVWYAQSNTGIGQINVYPENGYVFTMDGR